jgi:hypothetical protein
VGARSIGQLLSGVSRRLKNDSVEEQNAAIKERAGWAGSSVTDWTPSLWFEIIKNFSKLFKFDQFDIMGILIHHSDTSSSSSSKAVAEAVADATALTSSEATIMTSEAAALTVIRGGGLATDQLLRNALRKRSFIDQIITCGGDNNESKFYVHKLVMSVHSR